MKYLRPAIESKRERERENLNLDSKTFILKDGCIRSILTHLTASPCYYATERERERERGLTLEVPLSISALTKWQKKYDWFLFQSIPNVSCFWLLLFADYFENSQLKIYDIEKY